MKSLKTLRNQSLNYFGYNKNLRPFYIIAIILGISSSICSIIGPNKLAELTDTITEGIITGIDIDKVISIAIFMVGLYITSALFSFFTSFIMATTANKLAKKLRTNISKKINKLPLKYFDKHSFGDILSRVTNDIDTIGMSISQNLGTFVSAIALLISCIIMMFYTNYILAITAILSSIIGKSQKYFNSKQMELGKLNGHIEEMYAGYNVVRAYNGKKKAILEFERLNEGLFTSSRKSTFLSGLMQPIMSFIGNFSYVAVCIVRSNTCKRRNNHIWNNCCIYFVCKTIYIATSANRTRSNKPSISSSCK